MTARPLVLLHSLTAADTHAADGELLRRYAETGDETAFAELVRRNGPLVLRACRNVLRNSADADDAFQVTFILLARNAAKLSGRPCVAGWLHTVAVRSAGKIRRAKARRRWRERIDCEPSSGAGSEDPTWAEVREHIDAELARLPDEYRLPLLLCYVRGLSYADAARHLGWTLGTLRGRLERGREVLRRRLERWGLPVALVLVGSVSPAVGADLRDATLAAVRSVGSVSARIAGAWVKWAVAVALVTSAVAGIGLAALTGPDNPPKLEAALPPAAAASAVPKSDAVGDALPPGALARMGSSRFHHGSNIHRLSVSDDGKWIVSFGIFNGYRIWDLATGKEQVPVGMPPDALFKGTGSKGKAVQWEVAIAPAGKRVVAVVPDRKQKQFVTRVLDAVTGEEVATVPESLSYLRIRPGQTSDKEPELSPDGRWMLWTRGTSSAMSVSVADLTQKKPTPNVFTKIEDRALFGVRFSGDGKSVVMHFQDAYEVWDFGTRTVKLKVPVVPNGRWVGHAVISPDGTTLAVVHPMAATFQLWDVVTKKELKVTAEPVRGQLSVGAFSPDGRRVVTSDSAGPLRVWDVATGKVVRDYPSGYGTGAAAFTPDGKRVAVARMYDVVVLDLATGEPVHDFGGHNQSVGFVGFTSNERLVTASGSGLLWEPRTGKKLGAFAGHPGGMYGETVSPDGRLIATGGADQKVRVRDSGTLAELSVIDTKGLGGHTLAFTPDGKELAVGGDKPGIRMFDTATGQHRRVIAGAEVANWLRLTPDGRRVVFGRWSDRTKVRVWDRAADKLVLAFDIGKQGLNAPALSADGRFLAVGDGGGFVCVYDLGTGKQVREFDTNGPGATEYNANTVHAVVFSPDGATLAAGGANGTIHVWELATGGERFALDGHRGAVMELAFSPDGMLLASGSSDRSAVTWDATGALLPVDPKHGPKDAFDAWARLTDRDAVVGFAAVRYLGSRPAEAVPLLAKHLHPVLVADSKVVAGFVEQLGSPDFAVREAAEKGLAALGEGAADQLQGAAGVAESPQVRHRLLALVAPFGGVARSGDRLRAGRAVEAVERAGTAEARKLLAEWAGGARGAALTESARSALARLGGGEPPRR